MSKLDDFNAAVIATINEMEQSVLAAGAILAGVVPVSDTTPPSVPTNLVGTAVSSSRIDLSWSPSTDDVGVAGYRVLRGSVVVATVSTLSYSDMGLASNTQYSYQVKSFDAAGNESAPSTPPVVVTTQVSTNVVITPLGGGSLTDSGGNVWTFQPGGNAQGSYVLKNGQPAYNGFGDKMTLKNGLIWVSYQDSWWSDTGTGWFPESSPPF